MHAGRYHSIINKIPAATALELQDIVAQRRADFPSEHVAVTTQERVENGAAVISYAVVIYQNGKQQRVDKFLNSFGKEDPLAAQCGESIESSRRLLATYWPGDAIRMLFRAGLHDGTYRYAVSRHNDKLLAEERQARPDGIIWGGDDVLDHAWPLGVCSRHNFDRINVVVDEYSAANNLICLEMLRFGKKFVMLGQRCAYYLNPEKDYICQRYVKEELVHAPWQEDKSGLDEDGREWALGRTERRD